MCVLRGPRCFRGGVCQDALFGLSYENPNKPFDHTIPTHFSQAGHIVSDIFTESEVSQRYAKAAFGLALDTKALDAFMADLAQIKTMLSESKDLRRLLSSAQFASDAKLKGILAVTASSKISDLTRKTLGLLAQNGRLNALGGFVTSVYKLYDAHKGIVAAEVTSAIALSDEQLNALKAALSSATGRDTDIKSRVDATLLGGLKVRLGSRLFDASLKTQLDSLKFALKRA